MAQNEGSILGCLRIADMDPEEKSEVHCSVSPLIL